MDAKRKLYSDWLIIDECQLAALQQLIADRADDEVLVKRALMRIDSLIEDIDDYKQYLAK